MPTSRYPFGSLYGPVRQEFGRFRIRSHLLPDMSDVLQSSARTLDEIAVQRLRRAQAKALRSGIFLVLADGEHLDTLGPGDEVFVGGIAPDTIEVWRLLCHLTLSQQQQQRILPQEWQQVAAWESPEGQADLQASLEADETVAEFLDNERRRIAWLEQRNTFVDRALQQLRETYPDIDVDAYLERYRDELKHPEIERHLKPWKP